MTTPIVLDRPAKILFVSAFGVYSSRRAASRTLAAVDCLTAPPLSTRETVATDTRASAATSPMVVRLTAAPSSPPRSGPDTRAVPHNGLTADDDRADPGQVRRVGQHDIGDRPWCEAA